jgi:hypothetical protein
MNNDIQPTNASTNPLPPFMVKEPHFTDEDLSDMLATLKSFDRPISAEKPVTLYIALSILGFFAVLFGAGAVMVPNFFAMKAFHSLALGMGAVTCVALGVIHVLGARIRQI